MNGFHVAEVHAIAVPSPIDSYLPKLDRLGDRGLGNLRCVGRAASVCDDLLKRSQKVWGGIDQRSPPHEANGPENIVPASGLVAVDEVVLAACRRKVSMTTLAVVPRLALRVTH
jgi:hypothetical protein